MNLFLGAVNYGGVPVDEQVVRTTATPVHLDAPAAMAENAPDRNEVETDKNPNLGIGGRQLASTFHASEKYAPAWAGEVDAAHQHNDIINRQVSSSGTAAAREMAGEFGHGTMSYAEGIEPVADLVDGGKMTNNYFTVDKDGGNPNSHTGVQPANGLDRATVSDASAAGKTAAAIAAQRSMYAAFVKGM